VPAASTCGKLRRSSSQNHTVKGRRPLLNRTAVFDTLTIIYHRSGRQRIASSIFPQESPQALNRHESYLQRLAIALIYSLKISQLVNSGVLQCRARVGAVFCAFPWCLARFICPRRRRARNPFACTRCGDQPPPSSPTRTCRIGIEISRSRPAASRRPSVCVNRGVDPRLHVDRARLTTRVPRQRPDCRNGAISGARPALDAPVGSPPAIDAGPLQAA
jgi:hypothetical protein